MIFLSWAARPYLVGLVGVHLSAQKNTNTNAHISFMLLEYHLLLFFMCPNLTLNFFDSGGKGGGGVNPFSPHFHPVSSQFSWYDTCFSKKLDSPPCLCPPPPSRCYSPPHWYWSFAARAISSLLSMLKIDEFSEYNNKDYWQNKMDLVVKPSRFVPPQFWK